jgi:excisionase family DNA binding protein
MFIEEMWWLQLQRRGEEQRRRGMTEISTVPQLLTIDQLAGQLGITVRHVRRLVADKQVPYYKVGRLVRFDPTEISAWLRTRRVPGSGQMGVREIAAGLGVIDDTAAPAVSHLATAGPVTRGRVNREDGRRRSGYLFDLPQTVLLVERVRRPEGGERDVAAWTTGEHGHRSTIRIRRPERDEPNDDPTEVGAHPLHPSPDVRDSGVQAPPVEDKPAEDRRPPSHRKSAPVGGTHE